MKKEQIIIPFIAVLAIVMGSFVLGLRLLAPKDSVDCVYLTKVYYSEGKKSETYEVSNLFLKSSDATYALTLRDGRQIELPEQKSEIKREMICGLR